MSTSRRSTSSRGSAQSPGGARRPKVAGLRNRHQEAGSGAGTVAPETAQDTSTQDTSTQGASAQDTSTQDASTQDASAQDTSTQLSEDRSDDSGPTTSERPAPEHTADSEEPPASDPTSEHGEAAASTVTGSRGVDPDSPGFADSRSGETEPADSRPADSRTAENETAENETVRGDGGKQRLRDRFARQPAALIAVMLVLTAVFGGLAFWFHSEAYSLRNEGAAANRALVDQAATSQVKGQITDAVETLFSYDYANTAETEQAAKKLLTGKAVEQYDKLFETVKAQAPEQKLVLTTTVRAAGVTRLQGDRAEVLLFVDQNATRTDTGQSNVGPAQLTVSAEKHGDQWKISGITPR